MKTLAKSLVLVILSVYCYTAAAQSLIPCTDCDTIPSRYEKYYYTEWYDQVPMYGVTDSCWYETYLTTSAGGPVAIWGYANQPMLVRGLVALVDPYAGHIPFVQPTKLPEHLYLYQLTMKDSSWTGTPTPWAVTIDLQLLDSVRWDTVKPHWMPVEQGGLAPVTQYFYAYECYFENPVYVDTDFYIQGTDRSNVPVYDSVQGYYLINFSEYIPTAYVHIRREVHPDKGVWDDDCPRPIAEDSPLWDLTRGHCAIYTGGVGWHCPWPNNYYGMYLPIVDQLNIDVDVDSAIHGEAIGGGRYPIGWYDTITAVPAFGYRFLHWNDGSTDNPRIIHPYGDTSFTAYFTLAEHYMLEVLSANDETGVVVGGGPYPENQPATITAVPAHGFRFSHWNDGNTDNPRTIYVTQDTSFTAYFVEKPQYSITVVSADSELGTVDGGGIYYEGDMTVLTATPADSCIFDMWSDGYWTNPRHITVTQDSSFMALFIKLEAGGGQEGVSMPQTLKFSLSPNPTTGNITVATGADGHHHADIYDGNGRRIMSVDFAGPQAEIATAPLPHGHYVIRLTHDGQSGTQTFVKN